MGFIRNQRGFSLIEVMVIMGLISLVALYTSQVSQNSMKAQNAVRMNADFKRLTLSTTQALQNNFVCASNLQVANPGAAASWDTSVVDPTKGLPKVSLKQVVGPTNQAGNPGARIISTNNGQNKTSSGLTISAIELQNITPAATPGHYTATLYIEADTGGNYLGATKLTTQSQPAVLVDIKANLAGTTAIATSCGSQTQQIPPTVNLVGCWHTTGPGSGGETDACSGVNIAGVQYKLASRDNLGGGFFNPMFWCHIPTTGGPLGLLPVFWWAQAQNCVPGP